MKKNNVMGRLICIFICFSISIVGCISKEKMKRISVGEYDMEGEFINDSIPNGLIKYYLPKTNILVASKEFVNGILNGKSTNYHESRVIQIVNFKFGSENGFGYIFDSSNSFLIQKSYYLMGKRIGPSYSYDSIGNLMSFEFKNFENEVLFSVDCNSIAGKCYSDDLEKLENLNVNESIFNNERRLRVFLYLIYPPKNEVSYQFKYFDKFEKVLDSISIPKREAQIYWEQYLSYPTDGQKLALVVNRYDSVIKKSQTMITYIEKYGNGSN